MQCYKPLQLESELVRTCFTLSPAGACLLGWHSLSSQTTAGSSRKSVGFIQFDHKVNIKKFRMQILSSAVQCAPEMDLMQAVCPGFLLLLNIFLMLLQNGGGFFVPGIIKNITSAPNPGAFMSEHSKCLWILMPRCWYLTPVSCALQ